MLIALAGLPGSGKSAVAADLSVALGCALLAVDPVEAAMWQAGVSRSAPTGLAAYMIVEALAAEQLALGHDVIVDAVNAVQAARDQWRGLASRTGGELRFIEVLCSDEQVHQRRLEGRDRGMAGFREPAWADVQQRRREFAAWEDDRLTLDTINSRPDNLRAALDYLGRPDHLG